jgi:hypothetical protein
MSIAVTSENRLLTRISTRREQEDAIDLLRPFESGIDSLDAVAIVATPGPHSGHPAPRVVIPSFARVAA